MFKRLPLKPYLLTVFSTLLLLAAFIASLGVIGLLNTKNNMSQLTDKTLQTESAVETCRIEVNIAARNLRDMMLTDNMEDYVKYTENIDKSIKNINEQIAVFKQNYGVSDGYAERYEEAFQTWFGIASRALEQIRQGNKGEAKEIILNECTPALNNLVEIAEDINIRIEEQKQTAIGHNDRIVSIFIAVLVSLFILVMIISLYFAIKTTANITGTTNKMKDAVKRLSKGDIKAHVDYEANNEFGELAGLLNLSFTELSRYIQAIDLGMSEFARGNFTLESPVEFQGDFVGIEKSISKFRDRMVGFLTEMSASTDQVRAGAEQVSGAAQNLAQGATEQASSVEELSSSLNEISLNISQNADYAGRADVLGNETGKELKDSGEQIRQLLAAINDISVASEGIDKIIKVINEIAFQTKILALNAAVEAARAGQAGKGFAVVADEVRNLAQKSAEAAQDTSVLIENSLAAVKRGNDIAGTTSVVFEAVAKKSEQVLFLIKEIAAASKEQAAAVAQISQGIEQVSAVVQANSATSQQSAASSEDLYSQADRLKKLLSQFIITKRK